ncbi:MAG: ATP-binding protein [candidate division KSB1 bacterium]|nr:ATP-binding protein [candidate division KSB1 bacterium]MDZ7340358.1 ATP-binding protein [candidate division KSB1 bacterium]
MFYNREADLKRLNEHFRDNRAHLLIVYGRRRVGKTELLKQFAQDKDCIYFLADLSSDKDQLNEFSERIRLLAGDDSLLENPFSNWNALFAYLRKLALKRRLIVIIDEYQYLQASNRAIASIIQKAWDEGLKDTSIFLVLCGSYISIIEQELLGYKSPLYGRRTAQFFIEPMNFYEASAFFERYSIQDKIRAYGILGGIPAYLLQFDPERSVEKNIESSFLYKDAFLYNETRFLLMEELREPKNYFSILKAIAFGATRINEIVQQSGLDRGIVVKYLDVLQNLRIIHREVPVTEQNPEKSRKGIYRIQDHYFQFWFRFIMPNQSFIEEGRRDFVWQQRIMPLLDPFLGPAFEQVCIDFLKRINGKDRLPFQFDKIGRYWMGETEIDIVAFDLNRDQAFLAECKWSTKPVGINILDELARKSAVIQNEMNFKQTYYGIFSRSGFTDALLKMNRPDLWLFDLDDLGL